MVVTAGDKVDPNAAGRDECLVEAAEHEPTDREENIGSLPEAWRELGQDAGAHDRIRRMISQVLEEKLELRFRALEARLDALLGGRV